eukprot:m.26424 g.26424  ORF g.26424 m.26424 type:complete len:528 (+) comp4585_c0_seq1:94-1677(+)
MFLAGTDLVRTCKQMRNGRALLFLVLFAKACAAVPAASLPPWLGNKQDCNELAPDYIALHQKIIAGESAPRYLVFEVGEDWQLHSLLEAFGVAVASSRAFVVRWNSDSAKHFFHPRCIDWKVDDSRLESLEAVHGLLARGKTMAKSEKPVVVLRDSGSNDQLLSYLPLNLRRRVAQVDFLFSSDHFSLDLDLPSDFDANALSLAIHIPSLTQGLHDSFAHAFDQCLSQQPTGDGGFWLAVHTHGQPAAAKPIISALSARASQRGARFIEVNVAHSQQLWHALLVMAHARVLVHFGQHILGNAAAQISTGNLRRELVVKAHDTSWAATPQCRRPAHTNMLLVISPGGVATTSNMLLVAATLDSEGWMINSPADGDKLKHRPPTVMSLARRHILMQQAIKIRSHQLQNDERKILNTYNVTAELYASLGKDLMQFEAHFDLWWQFGCFNAYGIRVAFVRGTKFGEHLRDIHDFLGLHGPLPDPEPHKQSSHKPSELDQRHLRDIYKSLIAKHNRIGDFHIIDPLRDCLAP